MGDLGKDRERQERHFSFNRCDNFSCILGLQSSLPINGLLRVYCRIVADVSHVSVPRALRL